MEPPKRVEAPAPAPLLTKPSRPRFGDLELDRHAVAVRGPRGDLELSLGEFRVCALLIEAAGATLPWAKFAGGCGVDLRSGHKALELAISRLRSHLYRRGSTVTIASIRGIGWRLVSGNTSRILQERLGSDAGKPGVQAPTSPKPLPNNSCQP